MHIAIKKENEQVYLQKIMGKHQEKQLAEMGYKIINIDEDIDNICGYDFNPQTLEFDRARYKHRKDKENAVAEINTLKQWFDIDYMRAEQKYRRLHTLQLLCDNGTTPYDMLIWLYKEAEVKRQRIQELEGLINE